MKRYLFFFSITLSMFLISYVSAEEEMEHKMVERMESHQHMNEEADIDAKEKEAKTKAVIVGNKICPVMRNEIIEEFAVKVEHEGKIYNLCCLGCLKEFKKNPEKYVKIVKAIMKEKNE